MSTDHRNYRHYSDGNADIITEGERVLYIADALRGMSHPHPNAYAALSCLARSIFVEVIAIALHWCDRCPDCDDRREAITLAWDIIDDAIVDGNGLVLAGQCSRYALDAKRGRPIPPIIASAIRLEGGRS